jgi:hypothetical protein
MNPVIGLDVSKGESQVQAFLDKGNASRSISRGTWVLINYHKPTNFL